MLAGLVREPEESEEGKCTRDGRPQPEVDDRHALRARAPDDCRVLVDAVEVRVELREAAPRVRVLLEVGDGIVGGEGDGEHGLDGGEAHEAEVAVVREVLVGGHELRELLAAVEERPEGEDTVDGGDETDGNGPEEVEAEGEPGVGVGLDAADALDEVETVALVEPNYERS